MPAYTDIGGAVASLRVIDEFTAPIRAALERIAELEASLRRFRAASNGLSAPFTRLGAAIARAAAPLADLAGSLDAMNAPLAAAADELVAMRNRSAEIAASAAEAAKAYASIGRTRAPALVSSRIPIGGPGGGGREPPHRFRLGEEPGGVPKRALYGAGAYLLGGPGGVAALAGGIAVYESFKAAMKESLALKQTMEAVGLATAPKKQQATDLDALRELVRKAAVGTIYTQQETANALVVAAQMAGFRGQAGIEKLATIFPVILRMAEVGQMQHLGSIEDNIVAALGYAHLTTRYGPQVLAQGLDEVLAIAEATHRTISQVESTMKYALPIALGGGANVDQTTMLTGFLIRAGLGRTAGYAVGQMILGTLATGGPITAALASTAAALRKQLGAHAPKIPDMKAHAQALHALGILDQAGKLTVLNKAGGIDLDKLVADIQKFAAAHTKAEVATVLHAAFGTRGMRGAAIIAEQTKLYQQFTKLIEGTGSAVQQQAYFANTAIQRFEQLGARLEDIGNELATFLLPALNKLLIGLVDVFDVIDNFLANPASILPRITLPTRPLVTGTPLSAAPLVQHSDSSGLAGAIHHRIMHGPIRIQPPSEPAPAVHLHTTNNVTVTVPPGSDGQAIGQHVQAALEQHDRALPAKIAAIQRQQRRSTFLDSGYASVGGYAP